jgi:hypothetical protein
VHPVTRLLRRRRRVDPLGAGVWRRAHDRFVRAVERVHQGVDGVPAGAVHDDLADVATRLAALVDDVHRACAAAQAAAPSAASHVPGGGGGRYLDAHRSLSRAATLTAEAAQATTMARVALSGPPDAADGGAAQRFAAAARHATDRVADLVAQADRLTG